MYYFKASILISNFEKEKCIYEIMIIDDEKNIREGLHYSIPWEKIDIDEVRDYASAEEALSDFSSSCRIL